jgi:DNA-binding MarR family transcriptional regulator
MKNRFETFTTQIAKISRNIRRIKHEEMKKYNLKSLHVSCLYYSYIHSGQLTATELCKVCDEDKAAVSRAIDFLECNGYVTQEKSNIKKYKQPIVLTEKGADVASKITNSIDSVLDISKQGLTDSELENFYKCLAIISENLVKVFHSYDKK